MKAPFNSDGMWGVGKMIIRVWQKDVVNEIISPRYIVDENIDQVGTFNLYKLIYIPLCTCIKADPQNFELLFQIDQG